MPTPASGRDRVSDCKWQSFRLLNVPPRVKDNYSCCESLMLSATKAFMCAAFMSWAGTADTTATPAWVHSIVEKKDPAVQWESLSRQLGKFVDEFVMTEFNIEKAWREQLEKQRQQKENQRSNFSEMQISSGNGNQQ